MNDERSHDPVVDSLCDYLRAHSNDDPAVESIIGKLISRSRVGQAKYGVTLARSDLSSKDWIRHAQEEALDLANYLHKLILMRHLYFRQMREDVLAMATQLEAELMITDGVYAR